MQRVKHRRSKSGTYHTLCKQKQTPNGQTLRRRLLMPFAKVQRVKGSGQDVLGFSRVGLIPRGCCLEQKRKIPIVQRFSEGEPNLGAKNRRTNEERSTRAQPRTGTAEPVLANCCGNKNEPVELGSNTNKSDPNHARLRGSIKGAKMRQAQTRSLRIQCTRSCATTTASRSAQHQI